MSEDDEEERTLARLLRIAGPRPTPPDAMAREVRAAAMLAWQKKASRRRLVRRAGAAALAAGLLVAVASLLRPPVSGPGASSPAVARVVRVSGEALAGGKALGEGVDLRAGTAVRTDSGGRLALRLDGDVSLRLDHDTRVSLAALRRVELERGTVYVDSGPLPGMSVEIVTPLGMLTDVGTQFEVRYAGDIRLRVREGRVRIATDAVSLEAGAGEQLRMTDAGRAQRSRVAAHDPGWRWAESMAPEFDTDGRALVEFLHWFSRETGHELRFADAAAERAARSTRLAGQVRGLPPRQTLAAVMATTSLDYELADGRLLVSVGR